MTRTTLAVAADYADAMLVARRWKNLLFLLILLFLLVQVGVFLFIRFYGANGSDAASISATQPAVISGSRDWTPGFVWLINFIDFLAIISIAVLAVVLLLITGIMLVGRLIGVAQLTGAFIACVALAALLFPWQSLWNYPVAGTAQIAPEPVEQLEVGPKIGLPGVLYTWPELVHRAHFPTQPISAAILGWARFVGWPVVAMIILFSIQVRSSRGLKLALGEAEVKVDSASIPPAGMP